MAPITRSKAKASDVEIRFESLCSMPSKSFSKKTQKKIDNSEKERIDMMAKVEELQCSICSFVFQAPFALSPCKHTFCKGCISDWLTRQISCPLCRQEPSVFHQNEKAEKEIIMLAANLSETMKDELGFNPEEEAANKTRKLPTVSDGMSVDEFKKIIAVSKLSVVQESSSNPQQSSQHPTSSSTYRDPQQRSHVHHQTHSSRRGQFRGRFQSRNNYRHVQAFNANQYGTFINNVNIFRFGVNPNDLNAFGNNLGHFPNPAWNMNNPTHSAAATPRLSMQSNDPYNMLNITYTAPNIFTGQTQNEFHQQVSNSFASAHLLNLLPNPLLSQGAAGPLNSFPQQRQSTHNISNTANTYVPPSQFANGTNNRICLNPRNANQVNLPSVNLLNATTLMPPPVSVASPSQLWANAVRGVNLFRPLIPSSAAAVAPPPLLLSETVPHIRYPELGQIQFDANSQLFVHYFG